MTPGTVIQMLRVVEANFTDVLDGRSAAVLAQCRASVTKSAGEFDRARRLTPPEPRLWGYSISPEKPLIFQRADLDRHAVRFDIYGEQWWSTPEGEQETSVLVVRAWSLDADVMFRTQFDADSIFDALGDDPARVMLRFHFDRGNAGQSGPEFHLQIGGQQGPGELCWLHEDFSYPRLASLSMDLMLTIELIAANIHGINSAPLREETTVGAIRASQSALLSRQLTAMRAALDAGTSVLAAQWTGL